MILQHTTINGTKSYLFGCLEAHLPLRTYSPPKQNERGIKSEEKNRKETEL
jgi:hypothetical protein